MLHYNNIIYQSLKKISGDWHAGQVQWFFVWNYFKFYPDGYFITASIAGDDVVKVNETLVRGSPNIAQGKFSIDGRHLMLFFDGGINVKGYINNDRSIIVEGKLGWDIFYPKL